VLNEEVVVGLGNPIEVIDAVTAEEKQELERRELAYRGSYAEPEVRGKTVILIDDGIATGSTVRAAVRALNAQHPARFIVAVPTAAGSAYRELRPEVDELVALMRPKPFYKGVDGVDRLCARGGRTLDGAHALRRGFGQIRAG
jgi:putative phosphoribosyl transferase